MLRTFGGGTPALSDRFCSPQHYATGDRVYGGQRKALTSYFRLYGGQRYALTSCFRLYGGQRNAPNIALMVLLLYAENISLSTA